MTFIKFIPTPGSCRSAEHEPPTHTVMKPGIHIYQCPDCRHKQTINVPKKDMGTNQDKKYKNCGRSDHNYMVARSRSDKTVLFCTKCAKTLNV